MLRLDRSGTQAPGNTSHLIVTPATALGNRIDANCRSRCAGRSLSGTATLGVTATGRRAGGGFALWNPHGNVVTALRRLARK